MSAEIIGSYGNSYCLAYVGSLATGAYVGSMATGAYVVNVTASRFMKNTYLALFFKVLCKDEAGGFYVFGVFGRFFSVLS